MLNRVAYYLQGAVNETFNLYRNFGYNFYSFSLSLVILTNIAGLLLAFSVTWGAAFIFDDLPGKTGGSVFDLVMFQGAMRNSSFMMKLLENSRLIFAVIIPMYSLYLHKCYRNGFPAKPGLNSMFRSFSHDEKNYFWYSLILVCVFGFVFYPELIDMYGSGAGWIDGSKLSYYDHGAYIRYNSLNTLYGLIPSFLPYFFSAALLYVLLKSEYIIRGVKHFRDVFIVAMMLCYILDMVYTSVNTFVHKYIIGLLIAVIPFGEGLMPGVISFCLMMVAGAALLLAYGSFQYQPFGMRLAEEKSEENGATGSEPTSHSEPL